MLSMAKKAEHIGKILQDVIYVLGKKKPHNVSKSGSLPDHSREDVEICLQVQTGIYLPLFSYACVHY